MFSTCVPWRGTRAFATAAFLAGNIAATPAAADWRKELGTFRIGMIEAQGRQYSPADLGKIRAAYAKALGMPVEIFQAKDFPSLIDAHASSRIEYALFTAQAYATAYLACECVEPLAAPVALDGSTGVRAVLIVDSALSLAGLAASKGAGVAGMDSISAFGVALASFQPGGVRLSGSEPWLKIEADMSAAVGKFRDGTLDGFFATVPSRESLSQVLHTGTSLSAEVAASGRAAKAVWLSEIIPYGPHAVRKNLAPEAKSILTGMLLGLAETDPDLNDQLLPEGASSFSAISQGAYALALDSARALAQTTASPKP